MDTISGGCVPLPRQYTFKTTKDTAWIEEVLDDPAHTRDRSAFIRELIIAGLESTGIKRDYETERRHNLLHRLNKMEAHSEVVQKVAQKVRHVPQEVTQDTPKVTLKESPHSLVIPVMEEEETKPNYYDKLDNMFN
jgi:hypothetical protein